MTPAPLIFDGTSHPLLAQEVAAILGTSLGKRDLHLFPDGEIYLEIKEVVQSHPVFVLQSLGTNPNDHLMELLLLIDALKRSAVESVSVVLPYYAYARQDRQDKPGTPISAKLVANLLSRAGVDRLITMDLHSEQIEGFFDIPVQNLLSYQLLIPHCSSLGLKDLVVVAPDKGGIKFAGVYAKQLDVPLALIDKERMSPYEVETRLFVGDVKNKTVLLTDDMCSTGGTLVSAAKVCAEQGATRIIAVVGHGLFIGDALENIEDSPIEMLITTNSIPCDDRISGHSKIRIVSIAPLLAAAISRLNKLNFTK